MPHPITEQLEALAPIQPRPVPLHYRVGLLAAAFAMVLLPLIYLALIGAAGYAVFAWAVAGWEITEGVGRGWVRLLVYATPLVAGSVVVLFMIKPLFSSLGKQDPGHRLDRDAEPELFRFVDAVCRWVGSPRPAEIRVDDQVNASASFRRGWLSLLAGDLRLTVGLPLVEGLPADHLAGVLAHEFGHFAQRGGMRLTYVVRSINLWFARVVYQRDGWDEFIEEASKRSDVRIAAVLWVARGGVWVSRTILRGLMWVGTAISSFLLRQMEFDADHYETHLAGSEAFVRTSDRILVLTLASHQAEAQMVEMWQSEGRLPANVGRLVALGTDQLPADVLQRVRAEVAGTETKPLDTHPCNADRAEAARAIEAEGLVHDDTPSRELFAGLDGIAAALTRARFAEILGMEITDAMLQAPDELVARAEAAQEQRKAAQRVLQGIMSPLRVMNLRMLPAVPTDLAETLQRHREAQLAALADHRRELERLATIDEGINRAGMGVVLLEAGFVVKATEFRLDGSTEAEARATVARFEQQAGEQDARLRPYEREVVARFELCMAAVHAGLEGVEEVEELQAELARLLPVLAAVKAIEPSIHPLHRQLEQVGILGANINNAADPSTVEWAFKEKVDALYEALVEASNEHLAGIPYPFEHAGGEIDLREHVLPRDEVHDEYGEKMHATGMAIDAWYGLYQRVVSRLAVMV